MARYFNTEGVCKPKEHYMVRLDERLKAIRELYVDSASNNQVFIDFLAQLRGCYLDREATPIFHSVILAGVYDIKNLQLKLRPDAVHQYNSPWNIAAEFDINMSFSAARIGDMLQEYEAEHDTGMDMAAVAEEICQYTSGYPYLVSAVCKIMDEKLPAREAFAGGSRIWTREGVEEAVKILLQSRTTLFDSMIKHINENPDLKKCFMPCCSRENRYCMTSITRP